MDLDPVATALLGRVERGVGAGDQLVRAGCVGGEDGDAQARRHSVLGTRRHDLTDRVAQVLGGDHGALAVGFREEEQELLSAVASDDVAGSEQPGGDAADVGQDDIARGVAQAVVYLLEVVEVEEDRGERPACALGVGGHVGERLVQEAAVRKAGEGVRGGTVTERRRATTAHRAVRRKRQVSEQENTEERPGPERRDPLDLANDARP